METGQNLQKFTGGKAYFATLIKGIFISYLITIPVFCVFAYILSHSNYPQKFISPVVIITTSISILAAGSSVTRQVKGRGWINGAVVGALYVAILYIVSSAVYDDFSINSRVIIVVSCGIATGIIGGILGVNFRRTAKGRKYKRI